MSYVLSDDEGAAVLRLIEDETSGLDSSTVEGLYPGLTAVQRRLMVRGDRGHVVSDNVRLRFAVGALSNIVADGMGRDSHVVAAQRALEILERESVDELRVRLAAQG